MLNHLTARLLAAGNDGGVFNQIRPDAGPAKPVVDKAIVAVDAVLILCIIAATAAVIIGLSAKRGGVMAGNEMVARHGQGMLVGGAVGLICLLGIGTLLQIAIGLAP